MESPSERVLVEIESGVGTVAFNNPERRNALSMDMWEALPAVMKGLDAEPSVRVIVLRGAGGKAFSAGADISQFANQRASESDVQAYDTTVAQAYAAVGNAVKPVIARIEGSCVGGGLAVALMADMRIATDDARFGIPAARLGVGYKADQLRPLVALVGPSYAKEIMITGRLFNAAEALAMGLVNRVLPRAVIGAYVGSYLRTIAANAPLTVRAVKASIDELAKDPEHRDMERAYAAVRACQGSADYEEGHRAFMEKRVPDFTGT